MKNAIKLWSLLLALLGTLFIYSCDDDDEITPVEVTFSSVAANSVAEDGDKADVIIRLSQAAPADATFDIALSGTAVYGTDYTTDPAASSNSLTISVTAGETSKTISIIPIDNEEVEGDKTITLALSTESTALMLGASSSLDFTIVEDDKPRVEITKLTFDEFDPNVTVYEGQTIIRPLRARYSDKNMFNVTTEKINDLVPDENGQGRRLLEPVNTKAILGKVSHVPLAGGTELGFQSFYFNTFSTGGGLISGSGRRYGVQTEIDQRDAVLPGGNLNGRLTAGVVLKDQNGEDSVVYTIDEVAKVNQLFHDGFGPWGADAYTASFNEDFHSGNQGKFTVFQPDYDDGVNSFRMSHIDGKARLVIDAADVSNYENIKVSFRLTTVRTNEYTSPLEGNESKPVELDIFAAVNVPFVDLSSQNGTNVMDGSTELILVDRSGASMIADGVVFPDGSGTNDNYFQVEELEFDLSERFALAASGNDFNNVSLVFDFQTPSREPTCIYIDNIIFTGTEK